VQVSGLCKPELNRVYYLVGVLGSYGHWQSRNGHNLYFSQRCCGPRWFIDSDLEDSHSEASLPLRAAPSVGAATVPASGSNWQVYCGELAAMIDSVHVNILPAARQHEARESGGGGGWAAAQACLVVVVGGGCHVCARLIVSSPRIGALAVPAGPAVAGRWMYQRVTVEVPPSVCASNPCQGRGRCVDQLSVGASSSSSSSSSTFVCLCPAGRWGAHCEHTACSLNASLSIQVRTQLRRPAGSRPAA
jgi:hypothetical protein